MRSNSPTVRRRPTVVSPANTRRQYARTSALRIQCKTNVETVVRATTTETSRTIALQLKHNSRAARLGSSPTAEAATIVQRLRRSLARPFFPPKRRHFDFVASPQIHRDRAIKTTRRRFASCVMTTTPYALGVGDRGRIDPERAVRRLRPPLNMWQNDRRKPAASARHGNHFSR